MINRKLTSLICAAAMVISAYGAHTAYAQKGVMFTAQSDWVTKDLASLRKGAKPYCVAAMQYSKDTILTIAQNKGGEFSFAFDFGGGYFDPSQPAKVILDAGAGQQRTYDVTPRSSRAIVVKLGADHDFMSALEKTGLLRIELGDQSLNFNLSTIDQGRAKLQECLDGVIVVSAPNAVPPPEQNLQSSNFENSIAYREMKETYEAQINVLRSKLSQAEELMRSAQMPVPDSKVASTMAVTSEEDGAAMPSSLPSINNQPQYESLHYEVKRLKQELAQTLAERDAAIAAKDKVSDMAAREQVQTGKDKEVVEALLTENKALKAQVGLLEQAGTKEVQSVRSGYNKLLEEHESLKAEKLEVEKSLATLRSELVELKANNEKSSTASSLKSKEIDAKFGELLEEKQRAVALESENSVLKSRLTDMEKNFGTQVERLKTELAQLRHSYEGSLVDVERLSKENGQLKAENLKAEVLYKQAQSASMGENEKLEAEFKELLSEKEKAISLESENAALRSKLQTLESDYKQQLAGMSTKYDALQKAYDTTREELTKSSTQIGQLKAELAHLDVENKKLEAMRSVESVEVDSGELLAAKKKAIKLEAEKVSLEAQLESLQSSYEHELGDIKSQQEDREHALRKKELEVAAIKAEAQRQLAEARAVKNVRSGGSSSDVVSSVVDTVTQPVAAVVEAGSEVVARFGSDVSSSVAEEVVSEQVGAGDEIVSSAAKALSSDATQAQRMEAQVVHSLTSARSLQASSQSVPVDPSIVDAVKEIKEAQYAEITRDKISDEMSVPSQDELVSVYEEKIAKPVEMSADQLIAEEPMEDSQALAAVLDTASGGGSGMDVAVDSGQFREILSEASIPLSRDVSYVSSVSNGDFQAYEWKANQVFGSAEQKPFYSKKGFDSYVLNYLENTQKRCPGEFAIVPVSSEGDGTQRVDSYEVACMGQDVNSAASLVFYAQDGKFTAVAHEVAAEYMDTVMDIRDKFVHALVGQRNG